MKSLKFVLSFLILATLLTPGCKQKADKDQIASVPEWAKEVIWYQIFVERFRNGDPGNDPTIADIQGSYPGTFPSDWRITPWGHDWYAHEPWLDSVKANGFYSKIQTRRYGGDLRGILDKLDYIQELGITAIYFNPLNDSPSLHKYDARNYRHIDRNFGPDPQGDAFLMDSETPYDPATWKWTSADSMFLQIVDECHKRGIRVIMDYSWNHTGPEFWAMKDINENGRSSEFSDWYNIVEYDDPSTGENEFRYEGWGGNNPWMPVFRKDIIPPDDKLMPFEGNLHSESLKNHIFNVSKIWLDPDNDGNPADGVDGFRLDVAGEVPMGFWRDYRKVVRSVNPQAYLVGEIWWLEWPDKLLNPKIFLEGDQYDAIMNYRWFRIARGYFAQAEPVLTPSEFISEIERINNGIETDNLQVMMNITSTHDTPRLSTSLFNKTMDKYNAKPSDNPGYKINKPDELTRKEQKMLVIHQFTYIGAPHIWNGDEVGMWGADDPDCRKPLVWDDIVYEDEKAHFDPSKSRPVDKVFPDKELFEFYKNLITLRKENPVLIHGDLRFILADDEKMLLGYSRKWNDDEIMVIFNRSAESQILNLAELETTYFINIFSSGEISLKNSESGNILTLGPLSAVVLLRVN